MSGMAGKRQFNRRCGDSAASAAPISLDFEWAIA
jgi:hypothetical protein